MASFPNSGKLAMIIYGTRTIGRTVNSGAFFCPLCKTQRPYSQIVNKRYFTLYFIPLFPVYTQGDYVQCSGCGEGFASEVLSGGAGQSPAALNLEDLRRAMLLILIGANRVDAGALERLRDWCHSIGLVQTTEGVIVQELQLAQQANANFSQFASARLQGLTFEQREAFLRSAKAVVCGTGQPSMQEDQALRQVASQLSVPTPAVQSILG
jgi:uncharacterized tellurite resistance protein B-like protein